MSKICTVSWGFEPLSVLNIFEAPKPLPKPTFQSWVRLGQDGLGWVRLGQVGLGWVRLGQDGLGWVRLGQVGLGWFRLGQVGLGWVRLVQKCLRWIRFGWLGTFVTLVTIAQLRFGYYHCFIVGQYNGKYPAFFLIHYGLNPNTKYLCSSSFLQCLVFQVVCGSYNNCL